MIVIEQRADGFSVTGHAGYAPRGQDIVCAAISTLVQGFVASMDKLTPDVLEVHAAAGNAVIRYENLSDAGQLLEDSFFVGVRMIADEYPDYVKII